MSLFRIIIQILPLAIRLAVVLAVFGLSAAQAGAAMHGKTCISEVQLGMKQQAHNHSQQLATHGSDGHAHEGIGLNYDTPSSTNSLDYSGADKVDADQSDCCKSFCSSVALLESAPLKTRFDGKARLNAYVVPQLKAAEIGRAHV